MCGSATYADLIGNQNFNVQLTVKSPRTGHDQW